MNYIELDRYIEKKVSASRFIHAKGVAAVMQDLASRFLLDPDEAYLAALWHDIAREMNNSRLLEYYSQSALEVEAIELKNPMLLHAPVGASLLYGFPDYALDHVFRAVRWHTLGSRSMGKLGAALYIADYVEPNRTHIIQEEKERLLDKTSLEAMVQEIVERQIGYLHKTKRETAPVTIGLYEALQDSSFTF